ncbi:short-chain dehydrogenase/reductase SDR family domain-containing protein [Rhizobium etli 8C-3]|uniref:Short subunit dehydrogenase n=4 Tax=Rhizobium/Agrobacterium group TaxID=227290 RepID=A0A4R3QZD9_9HYPH|nr:short-chain dehydrogenase/reductase SDR family domain-containing protein [Rhizobium etli 8C-3]TCU27963.1 short subunit dehydrogenase [Rhizobium azibense]TCU37251.1 short subunit dehydrogenase [Rhizobium azibense]
MPFCESRMQSPTSDRIARSIREQTGHTIETVTADLTSADDVNRVASLIADNAGITMLINNAGVGATAPLLQSDVKAMSAMIALNVEALTRLTYATVPGFVERTRGTIVNIASFVAITPERLNGVYGWSKAFSQASGRSLKAAMSTCRSSFRLGITFGHQFWASARH